MQRGSACVCSQRASAGGGANECKARAPSMRPFRSVWARARAMRLAFAPELQTPSVFRSRQLCGCIPR